MSSNLLKGRMLNIDTGESRIIDVNTLIAARIDALNREQKEPESDGFTQGLQAEEVDISRLVSDGETVQEQESVPEEMSPEEAQARAREIIQEARDAAGKILQDAIAEAESEAEGIRRTAGEEGYQEGLRKAEEEFQSREEQLRERQRELEEQYDALVAELEPEFVDNLTGIYEHIFHVELGGYRDILIQLIGDCLRGTEGSRSFQIRVSSEDFNYVSTKKARLMEAAGAGDVQMEIVEDPNLRKNACLIRTENGILDCGLETQLDELVRKLRLLAYEKK